MTEHHAGTRERDGDPASDFAGRHPGTTGLLRHFSYGHLPAHLQHISEACADLAERLALALPDGPELTTGLRKLLEAKDCFVRAEVDRHHAGHEGG